MNLYAIDIKIAATAYVKANSKDEAYSLVCELNSTFLELKGDIISDLSFDSEDLPNLSLSPAMTIHGPFTANLVDLVQEDIK